MKTMLEVEPEEHVLLFVNGRMVAEIVGGVATIQDSLYAQVRSAHCLVSLARQVDALPALFAAVDTLTCHVNTTAKAAAEAFWRGFRGGVMESTRPHPSQPGLPHIPPEQSVAYDRAYRTARGLIEALRQAKRGPGEAPGTLAPADEVQPWA